MKCQRKAGQFCALASSVLRAVLADQVDAGVRERAEVGDVDVLDRGEQLDAGGVAAGALAGGGDLGQHRARVDGQSHTTLPLRPAASPSRR